MTLSKTEAGHQVMKDRSVPLTPRQRAAFILIDGKRSVDELLQSTQGSGVTRADIEHLASLGLVEGVQVAAPASDGRSPQERYSEAYPIATGLTASLGLRGFRLNLAIEAAGCYDDLVALAPKIREAVGADKYARLHSALGN